MTFKRLLLSLCLSGSAFAAEPDAGFESIFDGTLKGWEGDPTYWRAENGVLIGEVRPETLLKKNSFIIWRGGELADFELKLEYRVSAQGNSGINYRSIQVPDPATKWAMQGYQADIDGQDQWSGQNYEERGRTFLAYRGQSVVLKPGKKPEVAKVLGDRAELQKQVKKEGWNQVHLVIKGNRFQHFTNGVLMSEVLDEDPEMRKASGLLGVQVHVGPPMKIEYRNIRVKKLPNETLCATGRVRSSSYGITINGRQLLPNELSSFRIAYQKALEDLHKPLWEYRNRSLAGEQPDADSDPEVDRIQEELGEGIEALNRSIVATRVTEFEVEEVFESIGGLAPKQSVTITERCDMITALQHSKPFAEGESGSKQGLIVTLEAPSGIPNAFPCYQIQHVKID